MTDVCCDVAVVGGGPAGAAAALTLVRGGVAVVLIEASRYERPRIGETLPAWSAPVLRRLGAWEPTSAARAMPSHAYRSAWGGAELETRSFIFDSHGDGWHLIRRRFDADLAQAAAGAGALLRTGTRVVSAVSAAAKWRLRLATLGGDEALVARALVIATGRGAHLARSLGARRRVIDNLVGVAGRVRADTPVGRHLLVEAQPDGWWYSAPVAELDAVAVLMTDAEICAARGLRHRHEWTACLSRAPHTRERLRGTSPVDVPRVFSAVSQRLVAAPTAAPCLAAGDAAIAVDPLSASGITRALVSGEGAGRALLAWFAGGTGALAAYERWLDIQFEQYLAERGGVYGREQRWPDAPFWNRRRGRPSAHKAA